MSVFIIGEGFPTAIAVFATKIADALGVTLDYLVKDGEYEQIDKETLKRLQDIQQLSPENKDHVFALLDAFLKQVKLQNIMQ